MSSSKSLIRLICVIPRLTLYLDSQQHHIHWLSEGIYDPRHHHNDKGTQTHQQESTSQSKESPKKESQIDKLEDGFKKDEQKFKNYIHKDEELEEEGRTYGGLM